MITSYAQNFEDVMLWRALGHIERGFYIDIGAQDPIVDSVSLAFYERGWRGIHVEPTPYYAGLLREHRPTDVVIQAAVGSRSGVMRFFEIPGTGISTADASIAAQHTQRGFDVREITVPCVPLSAVFESCTGQEIHWLKIDVEGFEEQVLSGWGSCPVQPWIVIVEGTLPLTQIETRQNWESLITTHGYAPVYFDGLNCYYVSAAHPEIRDAFRTPPNVFDGFVLNGTASAPFHRLIAERFGQQLSVAQQELRDVEEERARLGNELSAQVKQARTEHEALLQTLAEREQVLAQQLQAAQGDVLRIAQERVQRETEYTDQITRVRHEHEALLCTVAERERAVTGQLLAIQQQVEQKRSELALQHEERERALRREHAERERELRREHAERERTLDLRFEAAQQDVRRLGQQRIELEKEQAAQLAQAHREHEALLHSIAEREREVAAQLLAIQQQAEEEKNLLRGEVVALTQSLHEITQELTKMRASLSWRLAAPWRRIIGYFADQRNANVSCPRQTLGGAEPQSVVHEVPVTPPSSPLESVEPMHTAPTIASTLSELLALHDQSFIYCAYRTLLGRDPDSEGMQYYKHRLRRGVPKIQVLRQLRFSDEGRARPETLAGLDSAIRAYQRGQRPIIGWFFRRFADVEGNSGMERQVRAIEAKIHLLAEESHRRFDELAISLADLQKSVAAPQPGGSVAVETKANPVSPEVAPAIVVRPRELARVRQLPAGARDIYFRLKTAIAVHATEEA